MPVTDILQIGTSGLFQDTGATTPATTNNTAVAYAADQSGAANHATQATSGNRPLLKVPATGFNGQNAIAFDGTDDYLTTPLSRSNLDLSITFVARWTALGAILSDIIALPYNSLWIGRESPSNPRLYVYHGNGSTGTTVAVPTTLNTNQTYLVTVTISASGIIKIYIDGNLEASGSSSYSSNFTASLSSINYRPFAGSLAYLKISDGVLSDTERTALETPLATTYGISYAVQPPADTPPDGTERIHYGGTDSSLFANNGGLSGNVTGGRTIITGPGVLTERCRQNGLIRSVKLYVNTVGLANSWKIKVFRPNGSNYDLVSESATFVPAGTGVQTITPATPLACQAGDVLGVWMSGTSAIALKTTSSTANAHAYATGDVTGTNQSIPNLGANLSVCIEGLGTAPVYGFTGDSIMAGHNQGSGNYWYPYLDSGSPISGVRLSSAPYRILNGALVSNFTYLNAARGGQTFEWVNSTGMPALVAAKATNIVIHCGVNDAFAGRTWEQIEADLDGILAQKLSYQKLYFDEVLPDSATGNTDAEAARIRLYNTNLAAWCAANGVRLISMHDDFAQTRASTGQLDDMNPSLTSDGIHLSSAGVDLLASKWVAAFNAPFDSTKPVETGAVTNTAGTIVTVSLFEAASPPILPASGQTGWIIKENGVTRSLGTVTASSTTVSIPILGKPLESGKTVTIEYAPGNVTDSASNALDAFSAQSVTNNSAYVLPSAPAGLSSDTGKIQVVLNWNAVDDAANYNIYRDGVLLTTSATNSKTVMEDTGMNYAYTVTAVDAYAVESAASDEITQNTATGGASFPMRGLFEVTPISI